MRLINYIRRSRSSIPLALLLTMLAPIAGIFLGFKHCYRYCAKWFISFLRKHRPSFRLILLVTTLMPVLLSALGVLLITKHYFETDVLVKRAEEHAINQAIFVAAMYNTEAKRLGHGRTIATDVATREQIWSGMLPELSLRRRELLPVLVDVKKEGDPSAVEVGRNLESWFEKQPRYEDSDIRVLDHNGVIIASTIPGESTVSTGAGTSWYERKDIKESLQGNLSRSVYSLSPAEQQRHKYFSYVNLIKHVAGQMEAKEVSATSDYRVHVNVPIILADKLVGVVSVSRQPTHFGGLIVYFLDNPGRLPLLMWVGAIVLLCIVFSLIIASRLTEPIHAIIDRARASSGGNPRAFRGFFTRPFTRELGQLSKVVSDLVNRLEEDRLFTNRVVHDARNQIASSAGAVELISKDTGSMAERERINFLATIHANLVKLSDLFDELQARQAKNAQAALKKLREINIQGVLESITDTKSTKDFFVTFDTNVDVVKIVLPPTDIEWCLRGLVDNAETAGAKCLHISIWKEVSADVLYITVEDDGPGVSDIDKDRIFTAGFTTKINKTSAGHGLFYIRNTLHEFGGSITLLDTPSGAKFIIEIPHSS